MTARTDFPTFSDMLRACAGQEGEDVMFYAPTAPAASAPTAPAASAPTAPAAPIAPVPSTTPEPAPEPERTPTPAPAPATDAVVRPLRYDGWTPDRQTAFLRAIAAGATVVAACRAVGLSTAGAYALRGRAAGAAFALGWSAANHLAREPLADGLLARALDGQVEWYTRANGERAERFRYDNGLASRMLARLDREAAAQGPVAAAAARVVAGEFDAYLDMLRRDDGPARAGLFLATRAGDDAAPDLQPVRALARADRFARAGGGLPGEVDVADLDLAARAGWTAEQWLRAEAAGLFRLAPESELQDGSIDTAVERQDRQLVTVDGVDDPVWWDESVREWRTSFPPPAAFDGWEEGEWGQDDYARELSDDEARAVVIPLLRQDLAERADADAERDRWFAIAGAGLEPRDEVMEDEWLATPDDGSALFGWTAPSLGDPERADLPPASDAPRTATLTPISPAADPGMSPQHETANEGEHEALESSRSAPS